MGWTTGEELYTDLIDLILNTKILNDLQMLMIAADIKLLFEKYDCDNINAEETVNIIMDYYYGRR